MKKINGIIISLMFLASLFLLPVLPAQLPMHWNVRGEVDNFMPKGIAVWIFPGLTLILFFLFRLLPQLDPKKEKYKLFEREWQVLQTAFIVFVAYLQFVVFYLSLNPGRSILPLMFIGLGTLFIVIGNYLSKIRQNYFIGIKVPWTLASEDNWNKTHRFASWCFVAAGIVILAEAYFLAETPVLVLGSLFIAAGLPILYSFLLFKKSLYLMRFVYALFIGLVLAVFGLRLAAGEDNWICRQGQWVQHGHPNAAKPTTPCR